MPTAGGLLGKSEHIPKHGKKHSAYQEVIIKIYSYLCQSISLFKIYLHHNVYPFQLKTR